MSIPSAAQVSTAARWSVDSPCFEALVERCLHEDLAAGDITARTTVAAETRARASLVAKSELVFCTRALVYAVVRAVDPSVLVELNADDGDRLRGGDRVATLEGSARSLLIAERTLLNLLTRACSVATHTRRFVDAAGGRVRIVDTRKTMPGLRALDRHAVRCGGGHNHRNDLGSGVLIKENHIRSAGGIAAAITAARAGAVHGMRIECEVTTLDELDEAVEAGGEVIMLDNMSDEDMADAVRRHRGRVLFEASGGMKLERIDRVSRLGIDVISIGEITHGPPSVDLSLLFDVEPATS